MPLQLDVILAAVVEIIVSSPLDSSRMLNGSFSVVLAC